MFGMDGIKIGLCAVALIGSLGGVYAVYRGIQTAEADKIALQQAKLIAADQHAQDQRNIAALQQTAAQAASLVAQVDQLKEALHAVPVTHSCLSSPAGRAFSAWLHDRGGFSGAAVASPAKSMAVPSPTAATR